MKRAVVFDVPWHVVWCVLMDWCCTTHITAANSSVSQVLHLIPEYLSLQNQGSPCISCKLRSVKTELLLRSEKIEVFCYNKSELWWESFCKLFCRCQKSSFMRKMIHWGCKIETEEVKLFYTITFQLKAISVIIS